MRLLTPPRHYHHLTYKLDPVENKSLGVKYEPIVGLIQHDLPQRFSTQSMVAVGVVGGVAAT
jgi:hypothetical protein